MKEWYCADFETTTQEEDCRVWAWSSVRIFDISDFNYGNSFSGFLQYALSRKNSIWYFRNVKFDGEFILSNLFNMGFEWVNSRKLKNKQFTTLISDKGIFYSITLRYNDNTIEIRDSMKIINMSIEDTARAFGLEETKQKIDYHKYRPVGYELTPDEISYIHNDVVIDAKSLIYFFAKGLDKMTQGSDAMMDFESIMGGKKAFRKRFPLIEKSQDEYLRQAYKGGFVYVEESIKGKVVGHGYVLDVNSLFPSRMKFCKLPYGEPVYFKGKYKQNKIYDLYVTHLRCMFRIKENHIPTIQIKHTLSFQENEYLKSSNFEIVDLYLTSVDLELFLKHYYVSNLEYIDGYMFKSMIHKEFVTYVDKWGKEKIDASIAENLGLRTVAKLMMNCLYGKFGLSITCRSKKPYMSDSGVVKYELLEPEEREGVYLPVALFITAYGRQMTISYSQRVMDYSLEKYGINMYLYSDTDSIHTLLPKEDILKIFEVDKTELGKWDIEAEFSQAKYIRQKCYVETIVKNGKEKLKPTVAGLPKGMHDLVTYENFEIGTKYFREESECSEGQKTKKRYKRVKGGVILVDTSFKIKA